MYDFYYNLCNLRQRNMAFYWEDVGQRPALPRFSPSEILGSSQSRLLGGPEMVLIRKAVSRLTPTS